MTAPAAPPLYAQIADALERDVMAGRLSDGQRLPPERHMARELGVSLGSLRKALELLAERGLLHRVQGSGNYIRVDAERSGVYSFFRLELVAGGGVPSAKILDLDREGSEAELLTDPKPHRIRRLRSLDGSPVAIEEILLDGREPLTLTSAEFSDSLYYSYRTQLGLWIDRAEDRVTLDRVPDWCPDEFGLTPGVETLMVRRRSWSGEAVVEVSRTWVDTHLASYVQHLS